MSPLRMRSDKTVRHLPSVSDMNTSQGSSESSDSEPTDDNLEYAVHAPNINKQYTRSWLWFVTLICLAIIATGVRFGHNEDSSNPLVPKKLTLVDEYVVMVHERLDIAKTALADAKVVPGSNYTALCSIWLLDDYLQDVCTYVDLFDYSGTKEDLPGLSRLMIELNYSLPEMCVTSPLNRSAYGPYTELDMGFWTLIHPFRSLLGHMLWDLSAVIYYTLPELEEYSDPNYEFSYHDTSEEAIRAANETAWDVLAIFKILVREKTRGFRGHCFELASILKQLKKNIDDWKALVERFRNCTLPGVRFLQYQLANSQHPMLAWTWSYYEKRFFASDPQRPYDGAKAFIDIGIMPLLSRMELILETYSKHHFDWCQNPTSFLFRIEKLYAEVSEFAKPPSKRARWYSWLSWRNWLNRKPPGYPWVNRKLGVHWWMPSANEVHDILASHQEEVGPAHMLLRRASRDYPTHGMKCWEGEQAEIQKIWWRSKVKVSLTERLKEAWNPLGAYLGVFWKYMTDDRNTTETQTLYEVLGVFSNATDRELKQAFRTMVLKNHPDKNGGTEEANEKYRRIVDAYDVLKDPVTREHYDSNVNAASKGLPAHPTWADDAQEEFQFLFGNAESISKSWRRSRQARRYD